MASRCSASVTGLGDGEGPRRQRSKAPNRASSAGPADRDLVTASCSADCRRADLLDEPPRSRSSRRRKASTPIARLPGSPVAALESEKKLYGIQFHPRSSTPYGTEVLEALFARGGQLREQWSFASVVTEQVAAIREQVGENNDNHGPFPAASIPSVAAKLVQAIGDRLNCVFVDHGLMRMNEAEQVVEDFQHFGIPLVHVDARNGFLTKLAG